MINANHPFSVVGRIQSAKQSATIKVTHFIHFVIGTGEEGTNRRSNRPPTDSPGWSS
jgi:hypothetical protein